VDAFTSGNHIWDKKEVEPAGGSPHPSSPGQLPLRHPWPWQLRLHNPFGRPHRPPEHPGPVFIDIALDDPFRRAKEEVAASRPRAPASSSWISTPKRPVKKSP